MLDHRASPGLTEAEARKMGYEPSLVGEGKMLEAAVLICAHCNQPVIKNPLRTRERYSCMECRSHSGTPMYICDGCNVQRLQPNYVHTPFRKIVDLVGSGKATVARLGSNPLLIPTKGKEA